MRCAQLGSTARTAQAVCLALQGTGHSISWISAGGGAACYMQETGGQASCDGLSTSVVAVNGTAGRYLSLQLHSL